jgi:hypothetical protein
MRSKAETLCATVDAAERSSHFDRLCNAMIDWRAAVTGEPLGIETKEVAAKKLSDWLRYSRAYQAVSAGSLADLQGMVSRLMQDLAAERQEIRHFVPISNVRFNRNMEGFAFFRILKLDEGELDLALRNDVNRIFYPHAVVDTRSLSNCWLLEVTESLNVPSFEEALVFGTDADFDASGFPDPVEMALGSICLYGWERLVTSDDGVMTALVNGKLSLPRPAFPGVVSISDWLFDAPRPTPDWHLIQGLREAAIFDLDTPEATLEFEVELQRIVLVFESVKYKAPFIHAAARFMVKGFLSAGTDQLLWHITAIEALLGENSGSLLDTLKRRLSMILGTTEKDRKAARKEFGELYDFRSRLVHGDLAELRTSGVHLGHLVTARQMARGALVWMAQWLFVIVKAWPQGQDLPSREDILRFFDMSPDSRFKLKTFLDSSALAQPDGVARQAMFRDPNP